MDTPITTPNTGGASTGKIIGIILAVTAAIGLMAGGAYMLFYRKAKDADKKKKDAKSHGGKKGTGTGTTTTTTTATIAKGDDVKATEEVTAKVVKYADNIITDLAKTYKVKKDDSAGTVILTDEETGLTLTRIDTVLFLSKPPITVKTYLQIKTKLLKKA